jgi:D-3-phosphoglycerate dehydrogenase
MKLVALMESPLIQNFRQLLGEQIDAIEFKGLSNSNFEDVITVFAKVSTVLDHKLLEKFPNLKFIGIPATGLDLIDEDYCIKRNIRIFSLRDNEATQITDSFTSTPEIVFWHLISLMRKSHNAAKKVQEGYWDRNLFVGNNLKGSCLGILGYGRIGKVVAQIGDRFGMKVAYYDRNLNESDSAFKKCETPEELIAFSNVVSINISASFDNALFLDSRKLAFIKNKPFYLINTSRGLVVDEEAIIYNLKSGSLAGYATDVLSGEGSTDSDWLKNSPICKALMDEELNVLITPHIGGATFENITSAEIYIFRQLKKAMLNE